MRESEHFKALQRHLTDRRSRLDRAVWWLRESLRGLRARLRARRDHGAPTHCDVLLIHPSEKSRRQGRKNALLEALRRAGLRVEETVAGDDRAALRRRHLRPPPRPVPAPLYTSAARAADLLARYRARVILTERNGWPVSTFLRAFRPPETRVLHLAHGILSDQSSKLRFHDFDYYAVFGNSSLEYLCRGEPGFGRTDVLFAGPYFPLPAPRTPATAPSKALLFLGAGPDEEDSDGYRHSCELARQWLAAHPDWTLWVRPHPRGTGKPWRTWAADNAAVRLRPEGESLSEAMASIAAVWSGYTTAIIDCAVAGVPVIVLGQHRDYFECERFGVPRVTDQKGLEVAMASLDGGAADWAATLAAFAGHHIEYREQPVASLAETIMTLVEGRPPAPAASLPEARAAELTARKTATS
ncbi:hypothetical protein Y5W_00458 [Alcanivorax sp. 521-1]|uniref:Uncharacterized protein n=1 Tax=Alloalcanivorax profundimaris TaxID=2735259 RepID=A0ABS0AMK7_9GAMM|nr:hypothetical protein [Alloalcanivorax profundimaris]MBF5055164.1 hypothetical protein [Alloalcanivorax profundimaris]